MADILGLGMSHFGGFMFTDKDMAARAKARLEAGTLPPSLDHPSKWPEAMQAEWGEDAGASFAAKHRDAYFTALDRIREALDAFAPDVVVIFGDDQYECFKEDLIPPYCVLLSGQFKILPYQRARAIGGDTPNIWDEPKDTVFIHKGSPNIAAELVTGLMDEGFDPAYSYRPPHQEHLGHAFANTLVYLDHRRAGFDVPVIPFAINAYGGELIRMRGGLENEGGTSEEGVPPTPPAPSPARCFDLGRVVARVLAASPWRVALIATGDWSHGFLTEKNHFFYPDTDSDRVRFAEFSAGDYVPWRELSLETLSNAGQHELVNWLPMVGAMHELRQKPSYSELIESALMATNKCVAIIPPDAV